MFEVLVESGVRRSLGVAPRAAALSVHCAVALAAGLGIRPPESEAPETRRLYPVEIFEPAPSSPISRAPAGKAYTVVAEGPAVPDLPTIVPADLPATLPSLAAGDSLLNPTRLVAQELWGRRQPGPVEGGETVRLAGEVDEPVTILEARAPVYPPSLAAAGISGEVRVEFVVDTVGHCESGTIRVLASTRLAFEPPAIEAVRGTVYRPARAHGLRVRQLVSQSVAFRAN